MSFEAELQAVQQWLDETDSTAMRHFRIGVPTEEKADGTPVTVADRAVETTLRRAIESAFPGDAILGEEQGATGDAPRRWIVDPIDATKNYARGIPAFATLLALEVDGVLALGVVSAPAMRSRWWATRGGGSFRDGEPIRVSEVARLAEAQVVSCNLHHAAATGYADRLTELCARCARSRGFNDFWGYMLVAQGSGEIAVEFPGLGAWDLAAPKIVIEEAGGRLTSLAGEDRFDAGDAVATNGLLHDEVRALLAG